MRFFQEEEEEEERRLPIYSNYLERSALGATIRSVDYAFGTMRRKRRRRRSAEGRLSRNRWTMHDARLKEQRFRQEWEYKFRLRLDRFRIGFEEIRRYEHRFRIVSIYIYIYRTGEFLDRYMGVTTFAHRAPCYSFFPSSCVRSDFLTMYSVYRVTQYRTHHPAHIRYGLCKLAACARVKSGCWDGRGMLYGFMVSSVTR